MVGDKEVTRSDLVDLISKRTPLPKSKIEVIVNVIFDSMTVALRRGDGIEIRGFGSFSVRSYRAYDGRNPRSGEQLHVAPKKLPYFKAGKELRERVNASQSRATGTTREHG